MEKIKHIIIFSFLISALFSADTSFGQLLPRNYGRKIFPSPTEQDRQNGVYVPSIDGVYQTSPAYEPAMLGRQKLAERKYDEAKEAFKTAIRLEPMNSTLWGLYDTALTEEVLAHNNVTTYGASSGNLKPIFEITRTDSYIEVNTMYIVGHLKNISNTKKQKIELTARFFNENNVEIKKAKGTLRNYDKALLPNEICLFEIPLKDYPKTIETFRVEVSSWE